MDPRSLPLMLTRSRLFFGPMLLVLVLAHGPVALIGACIVLALLSDIFDGVIARRYHIATEELRVADSRADGIYTGSLVLAIIVSHFGLILRNWGGLAVVAILEAVNGIVDRVKYGRNCSHHAYSAKLWAFSGAVMAIAVLVFRQPQPYLWICIALGIVHNIEGLAMRIALPEWTYDVPGICAAVKIGRAQRAARVR